MRFFTSLAFAGIAAALLTASLPAQSYNFTVFAGLPPQSGTNDGAGSDARFESPFSTAVDAAGNVFVVDGKSHTIRRITPAGVVSTFAGRPGVTGSADGVGSAARFNTPQAVVVDSSGNVFVADFNNNSVRKITPDGTVSTFAGLPGSVNTTDGTGSSARFYTPGGLAVDASDNLYVSDFNGYTIRKITPAGVVSTLAGLSRASGSLDGTGLNSRFLNPAGLAVDSSGNIYVADTGNSTLRKITPAGVVTTLAGLAGSPGTTNGSGSTARFNHPLGVVIDGSGNLFVADSSNYTVRQVTSTGAVTVFVGAAGLRGSANGTGGTARFNYPAGLSIDRGGNFYVADYYNRTIRKITSAGAVTNFAGPGGTYGSADGVGTAARFNRPRAIAIDDSENLFVADTLNNTLRKITPGGAVSTFAGQVGSLGYVNGSSSRIGYTEAVITDRSGNVYSADSIYNAVRIFTPDGSAGTFAGTPGVTGSANGSATTSTFNTPEGLAIDSAGNVYVADSYNHTIRKISTDRTVTTVAGLSGTLGSADGSGTAARFNYPGALTVDAAGNIYVADTENDTIRKITPDGAVSTLAGLAGISGSANGTGSAARFFNPRGLALDLAGNILVADTDNHTVRRVTPAGEVTTIGGLASAFESIEGFGTNAHFYFPVGITVSKSGTLYILDIDANAVIRGEVLVAPAITIQPQSFAVSSGSTVILSAAGTGGALSYQWKLNGIDVPGATGPTLSVTAQTFTAGSYTVVITNPVGGVTSQPANISLSSTSDVGRIINLAIRSQAGSNAQTLIVGTVLGGVGTSGPKPLLLRGVGPTLTSFSVPGALADPVMTVFNSITKFAENDDWTGTFDFSSVGAFGFTGTAPKDAAIYNNAIPSGSYSIQISGKNNATGVALAEIYDATPGAAYTPATPRLINVSARTQVGTGGDILIAGFVIGGSTAKTVLIRAAGPALANFGVTGSLLNPNLELYSGSTRLYANDDWNGDANISNAGANVGAFPFTSATSKDSALLVTLAPGSYTAQVSGVGNTTGVALIEVYEVP